jgi:nucleoside-diphosphate-sugar epimerase
MRRADPEDPENGAVDINSITEGPERINSVAELEELLTRPSPELVDFVRGLPSPLVILGGSGKMGPTLAMLARRAAEAAHHPLRIVAVSRYSNAEARSALEARGIETIGADLLDHASYAKLPDAENILYLVGMKFGTSNKPWLTWATNTIGPLYASQRYSDARIAALSSGNVYAMSSVRAKGSTEDDPLTPLGEYPNSAVARERIFEHCSMRDGTRISLVRLSYALDMRYGVLHDLAQRVWAGLPVDVSNGYFNCIWQGDANEILIRSLGKASSPPFVFNMTSTSPYSVRRLALDLGELMGKAVEIKGTEANTALIENTDRMVKNFGIPRVPIENVVRWTAHWVMSGLPSYNKPTHFEVRDGAY